MQREPKANIDQLIRESRQFPPSSQTRERAYIKDQQTYTALYQRSIQEPQAFWLEMAKTLHWDLFPQKSCEYRWMTDKRVIEHSWFKDGKINTSYNCLDRHLTPMRKHKPAIIWQGEKEDESSVLTYEELHYNVCRFANALKARGIKKGDRVCLYCPMIPELAIAMLACARIGAIHSVVFGGFSAEALTHRIEDCTAKILITAGSFQRGGKMIPLKEIADEALIRAPSIEHVIVIDRNGEPCHMQEGRDHWWHEEIARADEVCPSVPLDAEEPLFILYTSGSTGKPKGVVHTHGGYLLHCSLTHKYIFNTLEEERYWCTADIGWITGHSYVIYGPLANGTTTLMFEGTPTYPDPGRYWQIIEKHNINVFYTAPTVIRSLIRHGAEYPNKYRLDSLKTLGTVGEPINPETWMWYYEVIGKGKAPLLDTWWQTETGSILISPLPGCHTLKPGSASRPFLGVDPIIVRDDGSPCSRNEGGSLCMRRPWPGMMRTMWGDHDRFIDTYFSRYPNLYFTGDGCRCDSDGDYWFMGRVDDVVNVSGHRLGTAEIESALVSHEAIAEAAVVPYPDTIKGQGLYAFVTTVDDVLEDETLKRELCLHVKEEIGPIAVPDFIHFAKALPKTRSGKIMRRILRKIAENDLLNIGDTTTLADPSIIENLIKKVEK